MATEQWVWLPHPDLSWTPATIVSNNGSYTKYRTHQQQELSIANNVTDPTQLEIVSGPSREGRVPNLVDLDEMGEGAVIHALRTRYEADDIYTNIGSILVSINPYKLLPIYSTSTIAKYPPSSSSHLSPPHVFQIASTAYHQLMTQREDQAVIISGESGAGKTEATKTVLSYLSEITQRGTNRDDTAPDIDAEASSSSTQQQILLSNPILESFGNSKTLRNNNSSRFGKYMQIHISLRTGGIVSAKIYNYLLEKSRVTRVTANERNYHVFYQLLGGLSAEQKAVYGLLEVKDYQYLSQSQCYSIDGVNDAQLWHVTHDAMQQLQFSETEIASIIAILAAILQLGNLTFTDTRINNMDSTTCTTTDTLDRVAQNLKLTTAELDKALRFRSVTIRGETSMIPLNKAETIDNRDALAKALYDRLFNWIVERLNKTLYQENDDNSGEKIKSIGILDIFGFEIFDQNLFEQFCINYANEKLQQHFNTHIFAMEMQLYADEGINATSVEFCDNVGCVELIESKLGIIKMLEEETMLPQGSDKSLIEKMHNKFYHDKKQGKNKYYEIIKKSPNIFVVKHYAGDVQYDSDGMLAKSKDKLHDLLDATIRNSQQDVIVEMWDILEKNDMLRQRELAAIQAEQEAKNAAKAGNANGSSNGNGGGGKTMQMTMSRKKISSLGTQFSQQLQLLMATLNACQPHFIRCIKPNSIKKQNKFDSRMVLTQLSYAGLFEAIKVRKSGFSYRKSYHDFLKEYRVLCSAGDLHGMSRLADDRLRVEQMLNGVLKGRIDGNEWQSGKTRVFMRNGQRLVLAALKDEAVAVKVVILQSSFRGCLARRRVKRMREFSMECATAMSSDDLRREKDKLKALLDTSHKRQYQLFIVKQMRVALEYMDAEDRAAKLLNDALTPPASLPLLKSAIESYDTLAGKVPSYLQVLSGLGVQKNEAERLIVRIEEVDTRKKRLRDAMVEENVALMRQIIVELAALSVGDEEEEVKDANAFLVTSEANASKLSALSAAIDSGDVDAIEQAVEVVRPLPADEAKTAEVNRARETMLRRYGEMLDNAILNEDDEHTVRKVLMPKLERLQFVDLVYQAQGWLDEQDKLRVIEKKRRESIARGEQPPAVTEVNGQTEDEDELTKQHNAEKQKRLEQMDRINAMHLKKRQSVLLSAPNSFSDNDPPPPPPPPADDDPDFPPPPPPPAMPEFDSSLEDFFPAPPAGLYGDRDAALTAALEAKDFARLVDLLAQCAREGHGGRIVRMSENCVKQWCEEEKVREMIERVRDEGYGDDEKMKEIIKKAGHIGMAESPEVKELRYIVYTMSAQERLEMRMEHAKERDNIPLLLYLLSQANDEQMESDKIDAMRRELERMGVSGGDWNGRVRGVKEKGKEENQQERYRRFMETYSPQMANSSGVSLPGGLSLPLVLSSYPFLRSPSNYAKHSILRKDQVMRAMLKHQKDDIPTSLLFLSTAHCGSKRESIRVKTLAKQCHKHIRGYMCDSYHPYPVSLGYEVVLVGVNERVMRDEILCQLIKQTTENRNQASLLLGLKLLYLCLSTFAPSPALSPFILSHLALFAMASLPAGGVGFSSVDELATNCWLVWEAGERERQNRERELAERRERGEQIDDARKEQLERSKMKIPSMQDIERLTMGTLLGGVGGGDDESAPVPATPSPRSAGGGRLTAAPRSPTVPSSNGATLSVSTLGGSTGAGRPTSPQSARVGGTLRPSNASNTLSSAPSASRTLPPTSATAELTFNYAPQSPTAQDDSQQEVSDVDSLMGKGFSREQAEEAMRLKGSRAEALAHLMAPSFALPPTTMARPLPVQTQTYGTAAPSLAAPLAGGGTIGSTANKANNRTLTIGMGGPPSLPPTSLSPRSAPPLKNTQTAASTPSSPAVTTSSPPVPPPMLSATKKSAPPPLPASASASNSPMAPPLAPFIAPPMFSSAPVAPMAPPISPGGSAKTKPPPLPAAPAAPPMESPMAPPAAPELSAPSAPPMAPPMPSAASKSNTIKAGSTASSPTSSKPDSKDALLEAIRQGKRMKRIGPPKEKSLAERMGVA